MNKEILYSETSIPLPGLAVHQSTEIAIPLPVMQRHTGMWSPVVRCAPNLNWRESKQWIIPGGQAHIIHNEKREVQLTGRTWHIMSYSSMTKICATFLQHPIFLIGFANLFVLMSCARLGQAGLVFSADRKCRNVGFLIGFRIQYSQPQQNLVISNIHSRQQQPDNLMTAKIPIIILILEW